MRPGVGSPALEAVEKGLRTLAVSTATLTRFCCRGGAARRPAADDAAGLERSGLADRERNIPNRIDTKFNLASMNKMFTGIAIAQLAEKGKLSFDDKVGRHLPDYPNREVAEKVTLHHLLPHTSGLGSYWNPRYQAAKDRLQTLGDFLPTFADAPLAFQPGDRFEYSNAGYVVLGLVVEKVSGESYRTLQGPGGPPLPGGPRPNTTELGRIGGSAGGGYSTAPDLLQFATALREHRLLSAAMTETVLTGILRSSISFIDASLPGARGSSPRHRGWKGPGR